MATLVTGGTGFLGSRVVAQLVSNGHSVVVVDNLSSRHRFSLPEGSKFYDCDIASADLHSVFVENDIEYVLHLAAQSSVNESNAEPLSDAHTNITGSINLFSLCTKHGVNKVVFSSTAAVYGNATDLPLRETYPPNPISCYGLSKSAAEKYLQFLCSNWVVLRCSNLYGPEQQAAVIPTFVDSIINAKPLMINGDGNQTRDFVFVEDAARAFVLALTSGVEGEIINISSGKATSINHLCKMLKEVSSASVNYSFEQGRVGEIRFSCLDNQKAKALLGWTPQVDLFYGLGRVIAERANRTGR